MPFNLLLRFDYLDNQRIKGYCKDNHPDVGDLWECWQGLTIHGGYDILTELVFCRDVFLTEVLT